MEWKNIRLGDYISIKSGLAYKGNKIGKGDSLLLGMGCVSFKDKFVESGARPYDDFCDDRFCVEPGDIVLATRQQSDNLPILAMPAIVPNKYQGKRIIFGTNLYKVDNNSEISNRFIFWLLKHQHYVNYIAGVKSGTAVQMVTKKNVEDYKFSCPPKAQREKIANILWAYDNLIENNTKRIKLLEQMAENLYKEWFVRFRFPGHENVEMENGLPKGWKKDKFGRIAEYFDSMRVPLSCMERDNMEEIYPYYGAASLMDYVNDYIFDGIYLLMGEDGSVISDGQYPMLQYVWGKMWVNNHAHVLQGKAPITTEYLYMMLKSLSILDVVTGVAQPKISQGRLSAKSVIIPEKELIDKWSLLTNPMFEQIRNLTEQNSYLTHQRDLLLPRLMSGKLKVKL